MRRFDCAPLGGLCSPFLPFALATVMIAAAPAAQDAPPPGGAAGQTDDGKKKPEADKAGKPGKDGWISLFDGKSLGKWEVVSKYDFSRHGKVEVVDNSILLEHGYAATGIRWTGKFPKNNYEISLEAMRAYGSDFFCGLTFPVDDEALTLVCGGWGGQVTGLSNIDDEPAIENDTCTFHEYQEKKWYRFRVRVSEEKIEAWLDDEQIVDLPTKARKFTIRWEMEPTVPLGICTWYTTGVLRNIRYRPLQESPALPARGRSHSRE